MGGGDVLTCRRPPILVPLHNDLGWFERRKLGSKCMSSFLCSTQKIYSV